ACVSIQTACGTKRRGFTLFELVVVLALLAVLLGLALAGVQKVRGAADRLRCQNNLKQLGIACHNCNDTYGKMPPSVGSFPRANSDGTLHFYLLPFLDQNEVFKRGAYGSGGYSVWNKNVYGN